MQRKPRGNGQKSFCNLTLQSIGQAPASNRHKAIFTRQGLGISQDTASLKAPANQQLYIIFLGRC